MANVENLTNTILEEARAKSEAILAEATQQANAIRERAQRETDEEIARIQRAAGNEAERAAERVLSGTRLSVRNEELALKQEQMDRTFLRAKEVLAEMGDADFKSFVEHALESVPSESDQVVVVPSNRQKALGQTVAGRPVEADEHAADGFVVRTAKTFLNFRFDALVDAARQNMESEIGDLLFEKEA